MAGVPSAWAADISLQIQATPREVSPSLALLRTRHSSPLLFSLSQTQAQRTADHAILFFRLRRLRTVSGSPPLSLSFSAPALRHSDILRHNVENRRTQGSFSFSFLTPNESRRLSPSLGRLSRIRGHAGAPLLFFLLSTRFATSLTFVFRSFSSASRIKCEFSRPSSAFPQTSTHSPATSSPCSSTRAPSALERKISLCRRGFRRRFLRKHSTTARELRRGARGRCPRRGEEVLHRKQGRRQASGVEHSPTSPEQSVPQ
jgi:hypothetical protein